MIGQWYNLWAGAIAVDAMCLAKDGRAGQSLSAGGLRITLKRPDG